MLSCGKILIDLFVFVLYVIFNICLAFYSFYILYFIVGWLRTNNFKLANELKSFPTISIIIPVRDEEEHIRDLILDIQSQNYPQSKLDIIIIDDDSKDRTIEIVKELNFSNVKVIPLIIDNEIYAYKKRAISLGVENSNAELIITTDGDCRMGPNWIPSIVEFYNANNFQLISAPVSYYNEKSWFEKVQSVEFQFLIGAAAACIKNGMPNTCNGANMAYTRKMFIDINGYEGIDDLANGDDEMLLHKVYKSYPNSIGFLKNSDAIVSTYAKSSFKSFIQQRKRWAAKSSKYFDLRAIVMVSSVFLLNLCILLSFPLSFVNGVFLHFFIYSFLIKVILDGFFFFLTLKFFHKLRLLPYIFIVELLYSFYIVYIGIIGNTGSTYVWKGRSVK